MMTSEQKHSRKMENLVFLLAAVCILENFALVHQNRIMRRERKKNTELTAYANMAQQLARNANGAPITEIAPEFAFCNNTNCMTCRAVKNTEAHYEKAMETLNIDPQTLQRLRQGPYNLP